VSPNPGLEGAAGMEKQARFRLVSTKPTRFLLHRVENLAPPDLSGQGLIFRGGILSPKICTLVQLYDANLYSCTIFFLHFHLNDPALSAIYAPQVSNVFNCDFWLQGWLQVSPAIKKKDFSQHNYPTRIR